MRRIFSGFQLMSDLPHPRQLKRASCQLPVSWYFDAEVFAEEQARLFQAGPNYIGHELMVPEVGDYHTLAWMDHAKVLVRNAAGIELLSNVCRHRQTLMLEGRGRLENIVCPLHRWTYDLKGELIGAPHFPRARASNSPPPRSRTGTGSCSRDRRIRRRRSPAWIRPTGTFPATCSTA
jgi:phenylpropionate dioxygenase-like ring-hydroxylating dioxygenase large terminal subunit